MRRLGSGESMDRLTSCGRMLLAVFGIWCWLPSRLAVASDLYVADPGFDAIYKFTPNGTRSTFASGVPLSPTSVAFNSNGDLFVSAAGGGPGGSCIYEYTPNGTQSTFATGLFSPEGLAFDQNGNLFVADPGFDAIYKFTPNGTRYTFASGVPLSPTSVAFNSNGDLFVSAARGGPGGSCIYEYTPNGTQSTFATGLFSPEGLAFTPNAATASLTNAVNATIITGGTGTLGSTVSNAAFFGAKNLNYTLTASVQSGSATLGTIASGTGSLAPSASQSCTVPATSTNLGINTISFTATDPNASNSPQTTTASLTVLDHSNASLSATATQRTQTINFGNVLKGATVPGQSFTIFNRAANTSAAYTANLKMTDSTASGDTAFGTNLSAFDNLAAGSGTTCTASLNTSNYTTTGTKTVTMSAVQLADDSSLPGAGSNNNGGMTITLEGNVGNAPADKSNSQSSFGTALTAPIAQNARARANSGLTGQLPKMCNLNCENRNNLLCQ